MGSSTHFLCRLPPDVRDTILDRLSEHDPDKPLYIADVVHHLSDQGMAVPTSEIVLQNAIAEAAIGKGLAIGFGGQSSVGYPAVSFYAPIRAALLALRKRAGGPSSRPG